ncbi:MAG: hypothetical protein CVT88_06430 [Candidatus Altiarchaeales archaeon HGW-Altiarchaeales-1]|nr:MAG: hypothetical protein CVT88_06430 [Candidatus Altiarchaeales archaeon HGW-Altiarchaeales-1]
MNFKFASLSYFKFSANLKLLKFTILVNSPVVSLTSAGYGDICPTTEISKIFTSFYLLFGVSIFFYRLFIIGEHVINKRMGRLEKMMQRKVKEENEESKNKI